MDTKHDSRLEMLGITRETVKGTPVPLTFGVFQLPLEAECFGGKDAEPLNALMSAFFRAAGGERHLYSYLEETPKTSLTVELFQALEELGYTIKKI